MQDTFRVRFLDEEGRDVRKAVSNKNISISRKIDKIEDTVATNLFLAEGGFDYDPRLIKGIWFTRGLTYVIGRRKKKLSKDSLSFSMVMFRNNYLYEVIPKNEIACDKKLYELEKYPDFESCDMDDLRPRGWSVVWNPKPGFCLRMLYKFVKREVSINQKGKKEYVFRFRKLYPEKKKYLGVDTELIK